MVDAAKEKLSRAQALALARQVDEVVAAKGKKVVRLDMRQKPPDDAVAELIVGPTGTLRAPTLRVGRTLLVGFEPSAYAEVLQGKG